MTGIGILKTKKHTITYDPGTRLFYLLNDAGDQVGCNDKQEPLEQKAARLEKVKFTPIEAYQADYDGIDEIRITSFDSEQGHVWVTKDGRREKLYHTRCLFRRNEANQDIYTQAQAKVEAILQLRGDIQNLVASLTDPLTAEILTKHCE